MKCDLQKDKLSGYLDGELAERERAEVERHIAACSECLRELGELKAAVAQLRGMDRIKAPSSVGAAVTRAIARPAGTVHRWFQLTVAAAAVALFAVSVLIISRRERGGAEPTLARGGQADKATQVEGPRGRSLGKEELEAREDAGGRQGEHGEFNLEEALKALRDEQSAAKGFIQKEPAPIVMFVSGISAAEARGETEALLKELNLGFAVGPKQGDRGPAELSVEMTDEQILALCKRLEDKKAKIVRAEVGEGEKPGAEMFKADLKPDAPEEGRYGRGNFAKRSTSQSAEKKKDAENRSDEPGPDAGSRPPLEAERKAKARGAEDPAAQRAPKAEGAAEAREAQKPPAAPAAPGLEDADLAGPVRRRVILRFVDVAAALRKPPQEEPPAEPAGK